MSYTVTFYNFSKRKNSTKVPSGSGTDVDVLLKENTSLYEPVFELSGSNFPNYTYANFQGKYYYVTDIVSTAHNLYEIHCELDPMGTARSAIDGMTAYVNRSSVNYDIWMKDVELSAKQKVVSTSEVQTSLGLFDGTGCYLLRVAGNNAGATGIATFALSEAELNVVLNWMFSSGNYTDVLSDPLIKGIFNPFQYIVSLKYTPIAKSVFDAWGTTSQVNFGWWTAGGSAVRLLDRVGGVYPSSGSPITLSLPAAYFNDFRDYDPEFTEFKLLLPGGNNVTLPSIWLSLANIYVSIVFDVITGDAILLLQGTGSAVLASFSFKCAAEVQIGQVSSDVQAILGDVAGAVGSFMAGNPLGTGVSAAGAVANILQPSPSILSQNNGMQAMITYRDPVASVVRYESGAYSDNTMGRMVNHNITFNIGTNNGYYKCVNASVSTNLPQEYKDIINNTMDSGFFLE